MSNKARRGHTLIRAFGIMALAILILVGIAGAAPFAYVTSPGVDTGTVFVIDTATNNVTTLIPVGEWPREAAVNSAGTKVYVAKPGITNNTVCVIDTATNTISALVDVGVYPLGVAVNPTGSRVYVTDRDSTTISVINTVIGTSTNTVMAPINVGMSSYDVEVTPDGKKSMLQTISTTLLL
ncbi:MAG: YncE family protein [Methanosarcina barkeri]|nr:YncE family protein [Methanosarcina sp. ERenArc_MAG2]